MPRVMLAWELGGGAGHCVNLAPISDGLAELGWDVWLAVRDLATAGRVCSNESVRYIQAPCLIGKAANPVNRPRNFAHILHNVGFGDQNVLRTLVAAWRNLFDMVRPDVVIFDHAPTALFASRWHDLRRVVIGTGFFIPPDVSPLPDLPYWSTPPDASASAHEHNLLELTNDWLMHDRLVPMERLSQLYSQVDARFLLTFRELDHYTQRGSAKYWGMWLPKSRTRCQWPDGNGPRIFAYLKPVSQRWNLASMLSLLQEINTPTLAYVADTDMTWLRKFSSSRLRFLDRPADVSQIAQECTVAISNGNAGTSTALLLKAVPQLLLPLYLEQAVFSRRVADFGAGFEAAPNRPEQMSARLLSLIYGGHCRERAQAFAEAYSTYDAQLAIREIVSDIASLAS